MTLLVGSAPNQIPTNGHLGTAAYQDADTFVKKAGDTMTGPLVLSGDPTAALQPATKQYADQTAGMVLLTTITPTATANVDALTVFSATYDNYMIVASGLNASVQDTLYFRFAVAGAVDTGSNYYVITSAATSTTTAAGYGQIETGLVVANKGLSFTATVFNVNDAVNTKGLIAESLYESTTTPTFSSEWIRTVYPAANTITGIRFYWNAASNFVAAGKIRIYGIRN